MTSGQAADNDGSNEPAPIIGAVNGDQLTVRALLDRGAASFPDRTVVTRTAAGSVTTTYREFVARVHRLAHALTALGVRPGDRVATLAWNHQRHLELYFAVPCLGAVLHTINLRLTAEQIGEIAEHAGDAVIFVDPELVDLAASALAAMGRAVPLVVLTDGDVSHGAGAARLGYETLLAAAPPTPFPFPDVDERAPAATCYSSATTGRPKGVVYSHRALYLHSMALGLADTWALSEADTVLPIVPMFHVNAWGLPYASFWFGARIVLPGATPTADDLVDLLADHGVTFAAAVPTVWLGVLARLAEQGRSLPAARLLVCGGAPLPARLLADADAAGLPMIHSYGMTEATPLVLVGRLRAELADEPEPAQFARRLRQGLPVPGLEVVVVAEDGTPAAADGAEIGELRIRGPWVAEEYERDERGRDVFVNGWYHTGDIVTVDDQGYLKVVDRKADLIKSGGEWISTVDLENALLEHPAVRLAAVVGVPDPRWTERPVAAVVLDPAAADPGDESLRAHLAERFPRWWLPERFLRLPELPLTSVGKFDKKRLRALVETVPVTTQ